MLQLSSTDHMLISCRPSQGDTFKRQSQHASAHLFDEVGVAAVIDEPSHVSVSVGVHAETLRHNNARYCIRVPSVERHNNARHCIRVPLVEQHNNASYALPLDFPEKSGLQE